MIFASLKEQTPNENRVAVSAETIRQISQWGHRVIVEQGTGVKAGLSDDALQKAGAEIVSSAKEIYQRADILLKIWAPTAQEMKYLHEGQIILANFQALSHKDRIAEFAKKGVTCFALDLLPRLSRAQSMDILSSQSNLAGYKAVIDAVAAHHKAAPMMMTAAGTVPPIKVLILGAGVAGLQAVATAKRLGAVVYVSDVRPEVKEQVESLGGRFLEVKTDDNFSDSTGYAKETTAEYQQRQLALLTKQLAQTDIVITTAQIPGRPAPKLITKDMLAQMQKGGVIVDMAADSGGNVEGTINGQSINLSGITVIGNSNLASEVAVTASALFAKNLFNFIALSYHAETKQIDFNFADELIKKTCICTNFQVTENLK